MQLVDFIYETTKLLLIVLLANTSYITVSQASSPKKSNDSPTLTFEQLSDGIHRRYSSLKALEVEYIQLSERAGPKAPGEVVPVPEVVCYFAYKGECRYRHQSLGGDSIVAEENPELELAFNGIVEQQHQPQWKEAAIVKEKQLIIDQDPFVHALAIPLTDDERAGVSKTSYFLPFALDVNDAKWKVLPQLEVVDGANCHVLESKDQQRIWIDPKIGFAMRHRETRLVDRDGNSSPGAHYSFLDFQVCADGIQMPTRIEIASFPSINAPALLGNSPKYRVVLQAEKVAVNNEVLDTLFTLSYPPGTVVRDQVNNRFYRIGDAMEELDIIIEEASSILEEKKGFSWIIFVNVIVVIALAIAVFYHARKRSQLS